MASKFKEQQLPQDDSATSAGSPSSITSKEHVLLSGDPSLSPPMLELDVTRLAHPALLVDERLQVQWQNMSAVQQIWHLPGEDDENMAGGHLFDFLFNPSFHQQVANWQQWLAFFVDQAHHHVSQADLATIIADRPAAQRKLLTPLLGEKQPGTDTQDGAKVFALVQMSSEGQTVPFWVQALDFQQGRLFVFESDLTSDQTMAGDAVTSGMQQMLKKLERPTRLPVCVMALRIARDQTLRTELLAEEYGQLLMRVWQTAMETTNRFHGLWSSPNESGGVSYFILEPGSASRLDPVRCALALQAGMADLGREWKMRKGWRHDLRLSIGLHVDTELVSAVPAISGKTLVAFGGTTDLAVKLSRMTMDGGIWASKAVIASMSNDQLERLRFGIFHRDQHRQSFVGNSFSLIKDLPGIDIELFSEQDTIQALAVTQVFDQAELPSLER